MRHYTRLHCVGRDNRRHNYDKFCVNRFRDVEVMSARIFLFFVDLAGRQYSNQQHKHYRARQVLSHHIRRRAAPYGTASATRGAVPRCARLSFNRTRSCAHDVACEAYYANHGPRAGEPSRSHRTHRQTWPQHRIDIH